MVAAATTKTNDNFNRKKYLFEILENVKIELEHDKLAQIEMKQRTPAELAKFAAMALIINRTYTGPVKNINDEQLYILVKELEESVYTEEIGKFFSYAGIAEQPQQPQQQYKHYFKNLKEKDILQVLIDRIKESPFLTLIR